MIFLIPEVEDHFREHVTGDLETYGQQALERSFSSLKVLHGNEMMRLQSLETRLPSRMDI